MIYDYEEGETLIIAPNQDTIWIKRVTNYVASIGRNISYVYVFSGAEGNIEDLNVRLRDYAGPLDSSVFVSEGIDSVEVVELPAIS